MQREYILYIPASYDGTVAYPVLFNFHGYTSNASQQMVYGDFRPIADTAGFLIVHPQGTLDNTGTTHFNVGFGGSTTDDVGFTAALLDTLTAQYVIDESRVYSTGMSNGGYMSFHLACNLSDRFAAVASVTGTMVPATLNNCGATHITPILQIHGTNDGTVPYMGSTWSASVDAVMNHWVTFNNCNPTPTIEAIPNTNTLDGSTAERFSYANANGCTLVEHYKITNGGHTWPGSIVSLPGTNYDFNASQVVWEFLSQFTITGGTGSCQTLKLDSETKLSMELYPNPAFNTIYISGVEEMTTAQMYSTSGKLLLETIIAQKENAIDVSNLLPGSYILKIDTNAFRVMLTR
jgi:polyhydroxybutyrate depolymerase